MISTSQTEAQPDIPWDDLRGFFFDGRLIPFLGAGASAFNNDPHRAAPTASALTQKLANKARVAIDCENVDSCGCKRLRFDLARIASYYQTCISNRPSLDEFLRVEFANPHLTPNLLHQVIARIARRRPMLIITTNYDDLLEKAFDSPGDDGSSVPYEIVVTRADNLAYAQDSDGICETGLEYAGGVLHWVSGQDQCEFKIVAGSELTFDLAQRSVIYKIHGSVPRGNTWQGGFLIAEEDYARFLGRMERGGIIPEPITTLIRTQVKVAATKKVPKYSLLFLGYGMRDWNLRVLLEELQFGRRIPGEERHFAFMRHPDPVEMKLLENRRVSVFDCDLAQVAEKLSEFVR